MLTDALDLVVDALTAGGVRATYDPRNLTVPGAIVTVDRSEPAGVCSWDVTMYVYLLAAGPVAGEALRALSAMHTKAALALGTLPGELVTFEHPATGDPLPAYQLTLARTISTY